MVRLRLHRRGEGERGEDARAEAEQGRRRGQRQPAAAAIRLPASGASAGEARVIEVKVARLRAVSPGCAAETIARQAISAPAPPAPWTMRATSSNSRLRAAAAASDAARKSRI